VKSIDNAGFFTQLSSAKNSSRIEINTYFDQQFQNKSGSGNVAKITFTRKKVAATAMFLLFAAELTIPKFLTPAPPTSLAVVL
jgi:hypothetical protein